VKAEIVVMGQFSAHAGKSELMRWMKGLPSPPKQTYLTHGETCRGTVVASEPFRAKLKWNASWPGIWIRSRLAASARLA